MDKKKAEKWTGNSDDYQQVFRLGINEYNASLLDFWRREGLLTPPCRVLDIGCGVGKYGTWFAELGCDVTLLDISAGMLTHAANNMAPFHTHYSIHCCDFDELTGCEEWLSPSFDLSISTMSPAIHDIPTLRKMSEVTDGWCFVTRFRNWAQPCRDALLEALGLPVGSNRMGDMQQDCTELIRMVSALGYTPLVRYTDYNWADVRSSREMVEVLCRSCFEQEPGEEEKQAMAERIRDRMDENGQIEDAVFTKVMWLYWNTKERKTDV